MPPSLRDKAAAIARELGIPLDMPLSQMLLTGFEMIGIPPPTSCTLMQLADALVDTIGVSVAIPEKTEAAAPVAAAATTAGGNSGASATLPSANRAAPTPAHAPLVVERQKAPSAVSHATLGQTSQSTMLDAPDIRKLFVPQRALALASAAADHARPYVEVEAEAALEVKELPSEKLPPPPAAPRYSFQCDMCGGLFRARVALANHQKWKHGPSSVPIQMEPLLRPWHGKVSLPLVVTATGAVMATTSINGKSRTQIQQETAQAVADLKAADKARRLELDRRREERRVQRELEEELGEQRGGSRRRKSYSAKLKLKVLDYYESVRDTPTILKKMDTFENDLRSHGINWVTASKWKRRAIEHGAAQEHASSLMRIDKESRRKGKYVAMEKRVFAQFKTRRARGRKCSPKWFVHTAQHIMRAEFPEHAAAFQGSRSWMRRFFSRFGLVRRKKTNTKNTTWEATEPVLQRYFRATRRRLRDEAWRSARATAVADARARTQLHPVDAAGANEGEHQTPSSPLPPEEAPPAEEPQLRRSPRKRARDANESQRDRSKWGKYLPHERFNVDQVARSPSRRARPIVLRAAHCVAHGPSRRAACRHTRCRCRSFLKWTIPMRRREQNALQSTSWARHCQNANVLHRSASAQCHRRRRRKRAMLPRRGSRST